MPRGRAGLCLVSPDEVRKAIGYWSNDYVASYFRVTDRTVRRWKRTGLALWYGKRAITSDEWRAFCDLRSTPRTGLSAAAPKPVRTTVDRHLSAQTKREHG